MLDLSPEKLLVVVVVALAVLGPQGITRAARGLGRARAELRRLTADVHPDTLNALTNPRAALLDAVSGPREMVAEAVSEPRLALADAIAEFKLAGTAPARSPNPATLPAPRPDSVNAAPDDPAFN
ncbi:MAG: twin-arginine translocase TatA/TatE family subunit [Acidimicrobiales bacterium]